MQQPRKLHGQVRPDKQLTFTHTHTQRHTYTHMHTHTRTHTHSHTMHCIYILYVLPSTVWRDAFRCAAPLLNAGRSPLALSMLAYGRRRTCPRHCQHLRQGAAILRDTLLYTSLVSNCTHPRLAHGSGQLQRGRLQKRIIRNECSVILGVLWL